ncbi:hypothetical protein ACIOC2_35985 [Streptomyces sp. NPDC088337]|uniref:hypothetical protein n=1 Tax=unclassified Streptomyces TaxID=2593676 RepID=UPI00381E61C5
MIVGRLLVSNPGRPGLFRGCLAWGLAAEAAVFTVADRVWRPSDEALVRPVRGWTCPRMISSTTSLTAEPVADLTPRFLRKTVMTLCETGTRGLIAAVFGTASKGETDYARSRFFTTAHSASLMSEPTRSSSASSSSTRTAAAFRRASKTARIDGIRHPHGNSTSNESRLPWQPQSHI